MINNTIGTKYEVDSLSSFQKDLKRVIKQGKDINKLKKVVYILADGKPLPEKYRDHKLTDNKYFKDCRECHIEPDWLLVYKYYEDKLEVEDTNCDECIQDYYGSASLPHNYQEHLYRLFQNSC